MKYLVEVKEAKGKGRGVFALKDFVAGEVVEECPVISLSEKECGECSKTVLDNYIYSWRNDDDGIIVLGYGFIYNHSYSSNARFFRDFERNLLIYKAVKAINKGEEITVNYNGPQDDKTPIEESYGVMVE